MMDKFNQASKALKTTFGKYVTNGPAVQQLCMGGVTGWCTGFLTTRIGKCCILSIGTTILLIGGAHTGGFIKVNFEKFTPKSQEMIKKIEAKIPAIQASLCKQGKPNLFVTGFVGGFLIGLAF